MASGSIHAPEVQALFRRLGLKCFVGPKAVCSPLRPPVLQLYNAINGLAEALRIGRREDDGRSINAFLETVTELGPSVWPTADSATIPSWLVVANEAGTNGSYPGVLIYRDDEDVLIIIKSLVEACEKMAGIVRRPSPLTASHSLASSSVASSSSSALPRRERQASATPRPASSTADSNSVPIPNRQPSLHNTHPTGAEQPALQGSPSPERVEDDDDSLYRLTPELPHIDPTENEEDDAMPKASPVADVPASRVHSSYGSPEPRVEHNDPSNSVANVDHFGQFICFAPDDQPSGQEWDNGHHSAITYLEDQVWRGDLNDKDRRIDGHQSWNEVVDAYFVQLGKRSLKDPVVRAEMDDCLVVLTHKNETRPVHCSGCAAAGKSHAALTLRRVPIDPGNTHHAKDWDVWGCDLLLAGQLVTTILAWTKSCRGVAGHYAFWNGAFWNGGHGGGYLIGPGLTCTGDKRHDARSNCASGDNDSRCEAALTRSKRWERRQLHQQRSASEGGVTSPAAGFPQRYSASDRCDNLDVHPDDTLFAKLQKLIDLTPCPADSVLLSPDRVLPAAMTTAPSATSAAVASPGVVANHRFFNKRKARCEVPPQGVPKKRKVDVHMRATTSSRNCIRLPVHDSDVSFQSIPASQQRHRDLSATASASPKRGTSESDIDTVVRTLDVEKPRADHDYKPEFLSVFRAVENSGLWRSGTGGLLPATTKLAAKDLESTDNPLYLRPERKFLGASGPSRKVHMEAALLHMCGQVMPDDDCCQRCTKGLGVFTTCVRLADIHHGACSNCVYNKKQDSCSFFRKRLLVEQGNRPAEPHPDHGRPLETGAIPPIGTSTNSSEKASARAVGGPRQPEHSAQRMHRTRASNQYHRTSPELESVVTGLSQPTGQSRGSVVSNPRPTDIGRADDDGEEDEEDLEYELREIEIKRKLRAMKKRKLAANSATVQNASEETGVR